MDKKKKNNVDETRNADTETTKQRWFNFLHTYTLYCMDFNLMYILNNKLILCELIIRTCRWWSSGFPCLHQNDNRGKDCRSREKIVVQGRLESFNVWDSVLLLHVVVVVLLICLLLRLTRIKCVCELFVCFVNLFFFSRLSEGDTVMDVRQFLLESKEACFHHVLGLVAHEGWPRSPRRWLQCDFGGYRHYHGWFVLGNGHMHVKY